MPEGRTFSNKAVKSGVVYPALVRGGSPVIAQGLRTDHMEIFHKIFDPLQMVWAQPPATDSVIAAN